MTRNQTEPPSFPQFEVSSFSSRVASTVVPSMVAGRLDTTWASARLSLAGGAAHAPTGATSPTANDAAISPRPDRILMTVTFPLSD